MALLLSVNVPLVLTSWLVPVELSLLLSVLLSIGVSESAKFKELVKQFNHARDQQPGDTLVRPLPVLD